MEKKPLIIRCSDGWIYGLFGYYEEAVEVAEQHVDGTDWIAIQSPKLFKVFKEADCL